MPDETLQSVNKNSDDIQSSVESDGAEDRFFSRWSNRKKIAREDAATEEAGSTELTLDTDTENTSAQLSDVPAQADSQDQSPDEIVLTDADMPAIDTLSDSSDYSGFFSKGVSPELRKQALRHLFRHAVFNQRDGLNDYDEDYTTFEPLGDTITSDMRWHQARKERELAEAEAEKQRQAELTAEQQSPELESSESTEQADQAALESTEQPVEAEGTTETSDAQQADAQDQARAQTPVDTGETNDSETSVTTTADTGDTGGKTA